MAVASPEVGHVAAAVAGGKKAGPVEVSLVGVDEKGTGTLDAASAISEEEEKEKEDEMEDEEEEEEEEEMEEEDGDDEEDKEGVKWLKHYSSTQSILIIGDGDFSFSRALAVAFCSGENLVSTSLDSYEALRGKYAKAESNIMVLKMMGATTLHGIDAKTMKHHTDLKMRRFDRIVFNLPHAGFKGREDDMRMINLHKDLVRGFFHNARHLLRPSGEIHVSHKRGKVYEKWEIEKLASESSLIMVEKVDFHIEDYPGYNHKRGDGLRCDEPFPLGPCCTFKFSIRNLKKHNKCHSKKICSIPSLGGSHAHPEILASDWSPSQPFWPVSAVNMPVTFDPYSLRIAQSRQPGFPVNFVGLQASAAHSIQLGNIHPMLNIVRPLPHLLPVVGGIAPPMARITSTSLFEPLEQPKATLRPSQSVSSYDFAREYQMNLWREFEMKCQTMPAGTSLDYFTFLDYLFRDPAEKEKWLQTMITLHATRW